MTPLYRKTSMVWVLLCQILQQCCSNEEDNNKKKKFFFRCDCCKTQLLPQLLRSEKNSNKILTNLMRTQCPRSALLVFSKVLEIRFGWQPQMMRMALIVIRLNTISQDQAETFIIKNSFKTEKATEIFENSKMTIFLL